MSMKKLLSFVFIFLSINLSALAYTQSEAIEKLQAQNVKADSPAYLINAITRGDEEQVKLFMDANLIDVNKRYCGTPFLLYAVIYKKEKIALMLLEKGADPRIKSIDGGNALFYAVKNGQTDVVAKILETPGIDIKKQRQLFRLPLKTTAKRNGYTEIYNMLVKYEQEQQNTNSIK